MAQELHQIFPSAVQRKLNFARSRYKEKQDLGLSVRDDWYGYNSKYLLSSALNSALDRYCNNSQIDCLLELAAISCAIWCDLQKNTLTGGISHFTQKLENTLASFQSKEADFISSFVNNYKNYLDLASNNNDIHLFLALESLALKWWEEYQSDRRYKIIRLHLSLKSSECKSTQISDGTSFVGEYLDGSVVPIKFWSSSRDIPDGMVQVRMCRQSFNCEFWDTFYALKKDISKEKALTSSRFHRDMQNYLENE